MRPAVKKYRRDTIISFSLYGVILFSVNSYLYSSGTDGWLPVVLALLPVLPILYFAKALILFSRSWDELQRRIAFEATVIAFFVVGIGSFTYGFLEGVGFPALDTIWIMPMLIAVQGVAMFLVRGKYT